MVSAKIPKNKILMVQIITHFMLK